MVCSLRRGHLPQCFGIAFIHHLQHVTDQRVAGDLVDGQVLHLPADIHQGDLNVLLELHGLECLAYPPLDLRIKLLIEVCPLGSVTSLVLELTSEVAAVNGISHLIQYIGVLTGCIPPCLGCGIDSTG